MASYGTVPLNNGPAYAQPSYAPIDDNGTAVSASQYMLISPSQTTQTKPKVVEPMDGGSVCVWDATGSYFCNKDKGYDLYNSRTILTAPAMFEGFSGKAKEVEGFCGSCSVDVPTPFM